MLTKNLKEETNEESFERIITGPIVSKLNKETKVLRVEGLDETRNTDAWLNWIKSASKKELNNVRSFLSNSCRSGFISLENLSSRI